MRKNKMKVLISALLILIMAVSLTLTGCGSPSNLEEYVSDNEKTLKELKSYCSPGMTVDVSDNTLTYTYKYEETFIDETVKVLSKELKENTLDMVSPTYIDVRDKLEKDTGFEDITLVITYTDADGTVLCSEEY